jgi:apolipoprotein N-acyltransferase
MLKAALRRAVQSWMALLRQPGFWEWLFGILLLAVFFGLLLAFAVSRHDAYLRLKPLICTEDLSDRQFFTVAMASPISILLMLASVGELWVQLESRRAGIRMRWFHILLFFGLALGLAILVLFALGC